MPYIHCVVRQSSDYSQANRDTHIVTELRQVHALRTFESHDTKIPKCAVVELSMVSEYLPAVSAELINNAHSHCVITFGPGYARIPRERRMLASKSTSDE